MNLFHFVNEPLKKHSHLNSNLKQNSRQHKTFNFGVHYFLCVFSEKKTYHSHNQFSREYESMMCIAMRLDLAKVKPNIVLRSVAFVKQTRSNNVDQMQYIQ